MRDSFAKSDVSIKSNLYGNHLCPSPQTANYVYPPCYRVSSFVIAYGKKNPRNRVLLLTALVDAYFCLIVLRKQRKVRQIYLKPNDYLVIIAIHFYKPFCCVSCSENIRRCDFGNGTTPFLRLINDHLLFI